MALTANFSVEPLDDPQEEVARATLLREKATTNYEALALSTFGRILEIVFFRTIKDPGNTKTTAELLRLWNNDIQMSRSLAAVFRRVCGASAEATDKAVVAHFHKDQNRTD